MYSLHKVSATVICDASHCPTQSVGGWAAWVKVDGVPYAIKGYGVLKGEIPDATVAEIYAALNGIWLATEHGATHILVRSDNMSVERLIKKQKTSDRLRDLWKKATADAWFRRIEKLESRHVKGHSESTNPAFYVNNWCDEHAGKAMRLARRGLNCFEVTP